MTPTKRRDPGVRSSEFTPQGRPARYLLDGIDKGFWRQIRAKAKGQKISIRALILGKLKDWLGES